MLIGLTGQGAVKSFYHLAFKLEIILPLSLRLLHNMSICAFVYTCVCVRVCVCEQVNLYNTLIQQSAKIKLSIVLNSYFDLKQWYLWYRKVGDSSNIVLWGTYQFCYIVSQHHSSSQNNCLVSQIFHLVTNITAGSSNTLYVTRFAKTWNNPANQYSQYKALQNFTLYKKTYNVLIEMITGLW